MFVLGSPVLTPPAGAVLPPDDESALRIGVLALAGAISAVGQTPELATPLPFTTTSLADVLGLDESLTRNLEAALQGTDLEAALDEVEGITLRRRPATRRHIAFPYDAHGHHRPRRWSTTTATSASAPTTARAM